MKKSKFISIILVAFCAFTACLMFACGGGVSSTSIDKLPEVIEMLDKNDDLFKSGTVDGVATNFRIAPLNSNDMQYNRCFVVAINYINKYKNDVTKLKNVDINGRAREAISKLEQDLSFLRISYDKLVAELQCLNNFDMGSVYIGALQQFQVVATEFIDYTYQVAFSLGEIERYQIVNFDRLKSSKITLTDTEALKDYFALQIGYDYFKVLIKSCNSINFKTELNGLMYIAETSLSTFMSTYMAATNYKNLASEPEIVDGKEVYNNEKIVELFDNFSRMQTERKVLDDIFSKFSLYNFVKIYDADIEKLSKDMPFANQYYERLSEYYVMLSTYTSYLKASLLN